MEILRKQLSTVEAGIGELLSLKSRICDNEKSHSKKDELASLVSQIEMLTEKEQILREERDGWRKRYRQLCGDSEPIPSQSPREYANLDGGKYDDETCPVINLQANLCHNKLSRNIIQLNWIDLPRKIFIIKKPNVEETTECMIDICRFLNIMGKKIYLEEIVHQNHGSSIPNSLIWNKDIMVDLIITIGGDGTLCWASNLFPCDMPPVFSIALGTLGFLTPFLACEAEKYLKPMLTESIWLNLRTRLSCHVIHDNKVVNEFRCLNDFVFSSEDLSMVHLHCYISESKLTEVIADGLIIASPTGSTAYSLSTGGSIVHPSVPGIIFNPICPHSLSFRPIILPDNVTIRVQISPAKAQKIKIVVDGHQKYLLEGDYQALISTSSFPVPSICRDEGSTEWFDIIEKDLHWNLRNTV